MSSYKDADKLLSSFKNSYLAACKWEEEAKDEEIKARANAAAVTFLECYLRTKEMPDADVQKVKHGTWYFDEDECTATCTVCRALYEDRGDTIVDYWNFCPNCGARLREEKEE